MTAIKYFASPILSDTIEGVERNKDIPLEYSKDIPEDSLICFDMDRNEVVGLIQMYREQGKPVIRESEIAAYFKIFDRTLDMEFDRDSKNGQGFVFNTPKIVC